MNEDRERSRGGRHPPWNFPLADTADLRTEILDFGGFDSSRILMSRGGTLMSIGNFSEVLSQQTLVGICNLSRGFGISTCRKETHDMLICFNDNHRHHMINDTNTNANNSSIHIITCVLTTITLTTKP